MKDVVVAKANPKIDNIINLPPIAIFHNFKDSKEHKLIVQILKSMYPKIEPVEHEIPNTKVIKYLYIITN